MSGGRHFGLLRSANFARLLFSFSLGSVSVCVYIHIHYTGICTRVCGALARSPRKFSMAAPRKCSAIYYTVYSVFRRPTAAAAGYYGFGKNVNASGITESARPLDGPKNQLEISRHYVYIYVYTSCMEMLNIYMQKKAHLSERNNIF